MSHQLSPRNLTFDAFRGVAAIEVMLFHITNVNNHPMVPGGYLAVDLFFLLSGYVLSNAYGAELAGGSSVRHFLGRRFVRLYPLFAIGLALGIARALGGMHLSDPRAPTLFGLAIETLAGALLIPTGFDANGVFPLDNPAWSLSLEALVNIAFCLWMVHLSNRKLAILCAFAAIAVAAVALHFGSLDTGWRTADYVGGLVRCLFSFTLGVLIARTTFRIRPPAWIAGIVPLGLIVLFSGLLSVDAIARSRPAFDLLCVLAVFPAIVSIAACITMRGWPARISRAIGDLSYPLYTTHYPLVLPLGIVCARLGIAGMPRIAIVALVCVIVAAMLVPLDRAVRARLDGRRKAMPASAIAMRADRNAFR